jgi:hypothetical protein
VPSRSNSHASDVCELTLVYLLNACRFLNPSEAQVAASKRSLILPAEYEAQVGRASAMVPVLLSAVLPKWIVSAHWVSRANDLRTLTGLLVDSKHNPSDVALKLSDGSWLGVSVKSGKSRDVPFKNPGFGSIDGVLGLGLRGWLDRQVLAVVQQYGLPLNASARKLAIRQNPTIADAVRTHGDVVLTHVRDALMQALATCKDVQHHLECYWLDAGVTFPPYLKITGTGTQRPFTAHVQHPCHNFTVQGVRCGGLSFEALGNNSIGVRAQGVAVMKLRVKFESEKLASPVKFSAEYWSERQPK